jgi:hypothetical protein
MLFITYASCNTRQEAMDRMLFQLATINFRKDDRKGILQVLSSQLGVSCFLCRGFVISRNVLVRNSTGDRQGVCPGYDDNGDGPVGCLCTKDDPSTVGVIHR